MKRITNSMVVMTILVMLGCAPMMSQVRIDGTSIYAGQSSDSVERAVGSPNVVSSGIFCKNSIHFFGFSPGRNTVEWVYIRSGVSTVIYLDSGRVIQIGQVPTEKIKR